jgi:hypothetical protein
MITKLVPSPRGGGRFGDLGAYIASGQRKPASQAPEGAGPEWRRLGEYVLDEAHGGEKVAASWTRNCGTENMALALKTVELTQRCAPAGAGGREGKTLHLVVSFAPGERLGVELMMDIEARLARSLGLEEHERIAGVHRNTDCWHMHIAINKVHPETLKIITPYQSWNKMRAVARQIELEFGLKKTALSRGGERYLSDAAAKMEVHEGRESFTNWARETGRANLMAARDAGQGWQALHAAAAKLGMELKLRGAGLVASPVGVKGYAIKASSIDRGLSLKTLTDRLGPFTEPITGQDLPPAEIRYTSEPLQKSLAARELSARFETVRTAAIAARDDAFKAMQKEQAARRAQIDEWAAAERHRLTHGFIAGFNPNPRASLKQVNAERREMLVSLRLDRKEAGFRLRAQHGIPTWQGFLEEQALAGDMTALEVLRERAAQADALGDTILSAGSAGEVRHVIRIGMKRTIRKDGTIAYGLRDGGQVLDRAGFVEVAVESQAAAELGLDLAEQRFGLVPINVTGSALFKAWVVDAAVRDGASVTFKDPELEALRRAGLIAKKDQNDLAHVSDNASNKLVLTSKLSDIRYRTWTSAVTGGLTFQGTVELPDGALANILSQGLNMYVQRQTRDNEADTQHLTPGDEVSVDEAGRITEIDRGVSL